MFGLMLGTPMPWSLVALPRYSGLTPKSLEPNPGPSRPGLVPQLPNFSRLHRVLGAHAQVPNGPTRKPDSTSKPLAPNRSIVVRHDSLKTKPESIDAGVRSLQVKHETLAPIL